MIFPNVSAETWARKYRLRMRDFTCPNCRGIFLTNKPVLMADCVGFQSEVHGCGDDFVKMVLKPKAPDGKVFWRAVAARVAATAE